MKLWTRVSKVGRGVLAVVDEIVTKGLQSRFRKAISSGPKEVLTMQKYSKQTLALRQASKASACFHSSATIKTCKRIYFS